MKEFPVKTFSEEKALVDAARDDPQAFRPLYEKYYKKIFLFIHKRVNDKTISADLTSQVFLKALTNIGSFRFQGVPFSAWLYRVAINECNDYFRKTKRERFVSVSDEQVLALHDELTADTDFENLQDLLPEILSQLTEDELYLLEMRYFDQRPFKEIAEILGISEVYAKAKVYRLLARMKDLFLKKKLRR